MPWRQHVIVDDLPDLYQTIAAAIGVEPMIELVTRVQKMNLYLCNADKIDWQKPVAELPEDYQLCIEIIGVEATVVLAGAIKSGLIYLRAAADVFLPAKVAWLRQNDNGRNQRRLAIATGLSQRFVYEALKEKNNDFARLRAVNDQMELF